eukprot:4449308-Ditylum_brightwellii.AAC.1
MQERCCNQFLICTSLGQKTINETNELCLKLADCTRKESNQLIQAFVETRCTSITKIMESIQAEEELAQSKPNEVNKDCNNNKQNSDEEEEEATTDKSGDVGKK